MFMKSDRFETFKKYSIIPETLVGIIVFFIIWKMNRLRFETNDDFLIQGLISGQFTGGKGVIWIFQYNHYLLNMVICVLNRIIPGISWYGIILVAMNYLSFLFSVNSLCSKAKSFIDYLFTSAAFSALFWGMIWYLHSRIQYTATAEIAAILGYVCFAFCEKRTRGCIYFCCLEAFAFFIRPNAMLLMIPMGLVIMLFSLDSIEKLFSREGLRVFAPGVMCLIGLVIIGEISLTLPMINSEYREANECNEARMQMFDYTGVPQYDEISDLLNNITKEKYDAFNLYMILDWDCSDESLQKVAEYSKGQTAHPGFVEVIESSFDVLFKNPFGKISIVLPALLSFALLSVILSGKYKMLVQVVLFHVATGISLGYIVYNGRTPGRVTHPIVFSYAVFLVCVCIKALSLMEEKHAIGILKRITMVVAVAAVVFFSGISARNQYGYIKEKMQSEKLLNEQYRQIEGFCNNNPQNLYIISHELYTYTSFSTFERFKKGNFIFSGGWYSLLPESLEYVSEYLDQKKKCYFVISEETQDFVREGKLQYLGQYFDMEPEIADEFITATGGKCLVYCVRK